MFKKVFIILAILFSFINVAKAVDPRYNQNNTDVLLYEAIRSNESMSIGYNGDSFFDKSISLTTANNAGPHAIADTLSTGYLVGTIILWSDAAVTVTFAGSGINPTDGSNSVSMYLPASVYTQWDNPNIDTITFANASGSTASIRWWVVTRRIRSLAP